MKRIVKTGMSQGLVLAAKFVRPRGVPILTYHSVDSTGSMISTPADRFEAQIRSLAEWGYRTLSLTAMCRRLRGFAPDSGEEGKEVVLTFDDGFKNNHAVVLPILKKYGFTATIFLTTGYLGRRCGWNRHPSIGELPLLSWEEIREMSAEGIDFGAHTVSHPDLRAIPEGAARDEISGSKAAIEDRLGKAASFFCYPYGYYTLRIERMVSEAGFLGGCTIRYGIRNRFGDRYRLRRIGTARFTSLEDFQAGVLGTYGAYVGLRNFLRPA